MSEAINSRSIEEICDKPSDEMIEHVTQAMRDVGRIQKEHAERERKRPYLDFIAGAIEAGFTEKQAEFLWRNRPHPPLSEWKA